MAVAVYRLCLFAMSIEGICVTVGSDIIAVVKMLIYTVFAMMKAIYFPMLFASDVHRLTSKIAVLRTKGVV